jgi:hypothetical protein
MDFFKTKTNWSNAEFVLIKICIASAYLLIGAYFHSFFINYYSALFIIFGVSAIWCVYWWTEKMRKRDN